MDQNQNNGPLTIEEIANRLPEEYRKKLIENFKRSQEENRRLRVYTDGCFDLFHFAHARQFEQIKNILPDCELIVGVCSDQNIKLNKGQYVLSEEERIESIRHCKWVDEIIPNCPWNPHPQFMEDNKIDFVAHDSAPYKTQDCDDCYKWMKDKGMFLPTLRTEGISTTDLIVRILKDKDEYYDRNFKKGNSPKDFDMGFFEYGLFKLRKMTKEIKHEIEQRRALSNEKAPKIKADK